MTKRRIHLRASQGDYVATSICGWPAVETTDDRGAVTCKMCMATLRRRESGAPLRDEYSHTSASFFEATRRPLPMANLDARTRKLWADVVGSVADLIAEGGSTPVAVKRTTPFASVPHALAELVAVQADGFAQPSTGDPARIEALTGALGGRSVGAPGETRATSQAETLVHVKQALERVFVGNWDAVGCLTPEVCRLAVLLRLVGRKPGVEVAEMIAERMPAEDRPLVTPTRIARIVRYASDELRADLVRRELIEPEAENAATAGRARDEPDDRRASGVHPRVGEDEMAGWLDGWGQIALHLGVSIRTAQRWASEGMPTHVFRGKPQAKADELTAWVEAQRTPRTGT
jgi:hypothetical protein